MEECKIQIVARKGKIYEPPILEGFTWETERTGSPGKMVFSVVKTDALGFNEGDRVRFLYGNKLVFVGFIFKKHRTRDHHIEVTAYDQIRYLKNKTTYLMENVRADQVLKRICDDYHLAMRPLPNTGFVIEKFEQSNQTMLDIILEALELTQMATRKFFYLYDDAGYLALGDISASHTGLTIHEESAEDFDYTTSIDSDTYNRIVIIDNEHKSGDGIAVAEDNKNGGTQEQWGVLTHYVDGNNISNPQQYANNLLKYHNRISRALSVSGQIGDIKVRAGSRIYLYLNLGDKYANWDMVVDKVTHKFEHDRHSMDLTLIGHEEFYD